MNIKRKWDIENKWQNVKKKKGASKKVYNMVSFEVRGGMGKKREKGGKGERLIVLAGIVVLVFVDVAHFVHVTGTCSR